MAAVLNIDIQVNDNGTLAIRKVSEEAKKAEQSTNNLSKSTNNLGSSFTDLSNQTDKASSSFSSLSNTIKGIGIAAAAYEVAKLGKSYVETADKVTIIDSRLRLVTKSVEEQTKAYKELFNISQQTRLGFKETADLYSRIAISTKDYNISQEKLLSITSTINKAMILSGGTAESMNSAIIQLGQAFSGNFQSVGQELQSIREQTPALYQAIVAGSGMSSQAFKKAAEDGALSAEIIIKALEKQSASVDKDFDKMQKTFGQSIVQMSNSLINLVGVIDKSTGASASLSESITSISKSIDGFNISETVKTMGEYENIVKSVGVSIGVMYTATKAAAAYETIYEAIKAQSTVTTTLYNTATNMTTTTVTRLTVAQIAGTIAATALNVALRAIPFLAVAGTVTALATSFFSAKDKSEALNNSLGKTREELEKLSKNQANFTLIQLKKSLEDINEEIAKIQPKTKGFSYLSIIGLDASDEQKAKAKSDLDYLIQKKKDIEKAIKDIADIQNGSSVPSSPTLEDRFLRNSKAEESAKEAEKKHNEERYDDMKKWEDKKRELQANNRVLMAKDTQKAYVELENTYKENVRIFGSEEGAKTELLKNYNLARAKLDEERQKEWNKRKLELTYENEIAQSDELAKPFILLEKKYKEDLEHFKGNEEAKNLLTKNYYIEAERLQKDTIEKFNKQEEEKAKKAAEWQVKLFEANEKINDQFIAQREKMYGATSDVQIEAWYQNQLEWLGKLSLEGKATSEELQGLLDKINSLRNLKLQEQTLSFKVEKSFYNSLEGGLTNTIEDAFNGDDLNLNSFFKNIKKGLVNTISSDFSSGIVNNFKTFTGFGGAASLVGSTLSASDMSSLLSSGATVSDGVIKTAGGTVIDQASGTVTSQGSDALSLLNTASSLKTAYGLISNGISGSIISGFQSVSGLLAQAGFGSASSGLMGFGTGVANPFAYSGISGLPTSMAAGSALSGTLMGGLAGYGVGSLGDKIFGASTYAGTTGAIGGALGGLGGALGLWGGPIGIIAGSVIGSVLGGIFGKTKQTGAGIDIIGNATADSASGQYWQSYKKKSWFSSKSWTNYTPFSDEEIKAIESTIGVYDYLLAQLGEYNDLVVSGGRFSNLQSFLDTNVVKAFLVSINPSNLDTIYQSWTDYAAEIDKTITEALVTAVSGYTTYKRGYTEWFLGSGTVEQLAFTSNYLQKDFEALASSLGASSVTVDNFLSMYDAAIKNNFTQDTIEAWASLGDALMKSTDAQKAYQDALTASNKAIDDSITNLTNTFLTNYTSAMSEINTVALNLIGTISNLRSQNKNLSDQLNTYSSGGASIDYLISQYHTAKKSFMSNFDAKGNLLAGKDASMQEDYSYLESIIGQLSGAGINKITRGALVSEVGTFDTLFKNNENALKVEVVSGNLSVTEMAKALNLSEQQITQLKNTNSFSQDQLNTLYSISTKGATDQTLTSINIWLKSLYEVQAEAKIANTTSMSKKTFEAGHTLGTQEKIDFAKATGLAIGSESFNNVLNGIQGFATKSKSQDISYVQSMVKNGDYSVINAIKSLGTSAPSDALSAIDSVRKSINASNLTTYNKELNNYNKALEKANYAKTATELLDANFYRDTGTTTRFNASLLSNHTFISALSSLGLSGSVKTVDDKYYGHSGLIGDNNYKKGSAPDRLQSYIDHFNSLEKPVLKTAGFLTGGYTGDYGINEVAGVVHGQEYVLNAQTTKDLGINNNGGLFKEMVTELRSLRQEVSDLKQINQNHMRETTNGNNMLKRMSGGGIALSVKAVS